MLTSVATRRLGQEGHESRARLTLASARGRHSHGSALLNYRGILGSCFLPQPEQVPAEVHVVVRHPAARAQEPARAENRPRVRTCSTVSSSLWLTTRIAVKAVPIRSSDNNARMEKPTARSKTSPLCAPSGELRAENAESLLGLTKISPAKLATTPAALAAAAPSSPDSGALVTSDSPVAAKIALFRTLFRGREDVFAVRWQSKAGRSGYAPACAHEWDRALCGKPKVKCADCPTGHCSPSPTR